MYVFTSFSPTIFVQATTNERCAKTAPRASLNNPGNDASGQNPTENYMSKEEKVAKGWDFLGIRWKEVCE